MEGKNSIEKMLITVPKKLIFSGYIITLIVITIFISFFIVIKIPQNYKTSVELSFADNKIVGLFAIPKNYYEVLRSDSVKINVNHKQLIGIIQKIHQTDDNMIKVYVNIFDYDNTLFTSKQEDLLLEAHVQIVIKSTFLRKIINKQFLK